MFNKESIWQKLESIDWSLPIKEPWREKSDTESKTQPEVIQTLSAA